jgi:hypothetical protein
MKLLPIVATMVAHKLASEFMNLTFKQLMAEVKENKFDLFNLTHHLSSGMKSVYT